MWLVICLILLNELQQRKARPSRSLPLAIQALNQRLLFSHLLCLAGTLQHVALASLDTLGQNIQFGNATLAVILGRTIRGCNKLAVEGCGFDATLFGWSGGELLLIGNFIGRLLIERHFYRFQQVRVFGQWLCMAGFGDMALHDVFVAASQVLGCHGLFASANYNGPYN